MTAIDQREINGPSVFFTMQDRISKRVTRITRITHPHAAL